MAYPASPEVRYIYISIDIYIFIIVCTKLGYNRIFRPMGKIGKGIFRLTISGYLFDYMSRT